VIHACFGRLLLCLTGKSVRVLPASLSSPI
jgi:hypothetical protein